MQKFRLAPTSTIYLLLAAIAIGLAILLVASGNMTPNYAQGIFGLVVLGAAIVYRAPPALRMTAIALALFFFGIGGWLDFAGWRFLPPRGPLGSSP